MADTTSSTLAEDWKRWRAIPSSFVRCSAIVGAPKRVPIHYRLR